MARSQKQPWSTQRNLELGLDSNISALVQVANVVLARDFGEFLGTPSEQDRCVGFGHRDGANDGDDTSKDSEEGDDPLPSTCFSKESTDDGSKRGTEERRTSKDGHSETSLLCVEHVGECTAVLTRGLEPKKPERKRKTMSDAMLGEAMETACHMVKTA